MKRLLLFIVPLVLIASFNSCQKTEEHPVPPEALPLLKLNPVDQTDHSLIFEMVSENAQGMAYILTDSDIPEDYSAEDILRDGQNMDLLEDIITVDGLSSETAYTILAVSYAEKENDKVFSQIQQLQMKTSAFVSQCSFQVEINTVSTLYAVATVTPSTDELGYLNLFMKTADLQGEFEDDDVYHKFLVEYMRETFKGQSDAQIYETMTVKGQTQTTFAPMEEDTEYTILNYAISTDLQRLSDIQRTELTTEKSEPFDLNIGVAELDYYGDYFMDGTNNFLLRMHSGGMTFDDWGNPTSAGDQVHISVILEPVADPDHLSVSDFCGQKYVLNAETVQGTPGSIGNDVSCHMVYSDGGAFAGFYYMKEAEIEILDLGEGLYHIKGYAIRTDDIRIGLNYVGEIELQDESFKGYDGPNLEEDVDMNCELAYNGFYRGVVEGFGEYSLTLLENPDEGNMFGGPNKRAVSLVMFLPQIEKPGRNLPVGKFDVASELEDEAIVLAGKYEHVGPGQFAYTGTYFFYTFPGDMFGWITSGSVEISREENQYTIQVDAQTDLGYQVKASYTGRVSLADQTSYASTPDRLEKPDIKEIERVLLVK